MLPININMKIYLRFFIFFPGINAPINIKSSWRRQTRRGRDGGAGRARGYGGERYEVRGDARENVRDERGAAGRGWRRSVGRGEAWARRGGDSQAEVKASRDAGLQLRTGGGAEAYGHSVRDGSGET